MQEKILNESARFPASVNNFGAALVHISAGRFRYTQVVGVLKTCRDFPWVDLVREQRQVERWWQSLESHLDLDIAEKFFKIHYRRSYPPSYC
ncbi:chorismate mutase [Bartonella australis AUST/NH1]|uniref:Chorismate mutase n=1 Tax=Bartonella australis (strain Aust/NH1) TaxID=1094489 RepID=M1N5E0_BARAA|nr:chorismate mutase [Bartonella australis AUST/NH1]